MPPVNSVPNSLIWFQNLFEERMLFYDIARVLENLLQSFNLYQIQEVILASITLQNVAHFIINKLRILEAHVSVND